MTATALLPEVLSIRDSLNRLLALLAPEGPYTGARLHFCIQHAIEAAGKQLNPAEIEAAITAGGYRTKSKLLRIQIHNACADLAAEKKILLIKRGGARFYACASKLSNPTP